MSSHLSESLRFLLKQKKISARQLSKDTGIPQSTLMDLLEGKKEPSIKHLPVLSKYFGTTIDFLLTGQNQNIETLESLLTEDVFEGFLKVKIERIIQSKRGKA